MTTYNSLSYIQWLSKLIHCHKSSTTECCSSPQQQQQQQQLQYATNYLDGDDKTIKRHNGKNSNNITIGIHAENQNLIMKRREAVTEATEQNPFAGREYIKKMPYSSPQNFLLSDSPQGSQTSCDDIVPPPKNCYRLVMLGSARVGKTCIVSRFLGGKFDDSYTPTIEDFHRKLYRIRGEVYQLDLLDTSGNHPFPAMRRLSFLTGDMFVIVFSMDCRESWEEAIHLREQILETKLNAQASTGSSSSGWSLTGASRKRPVLKVPMVLAGNKCDSDIRTVTSEEASAYCSTQDSCCVFVECSAKKNLHIDDVFYELFLVANLPLEMAPNHHKRISVGFGAPCPLPPSVPTHPSKKYTLSIKRRLSDACGVVAPNVRRPSIRTDLMIMRTKTCSLGDTDGSNSRQGQSWSRCVLQ